MNLSLVRNYTDVTGDGEDDEHGSGSRRNGNNNCWGSRQGQKLAALSANVCGKEPPARDDQHKMFFGLNSKKCFWE